MGEGLVSGDRESAKTDLGSRDLKITGLSDAVLGCINLSVNHSQVSILLKFKMISSVNYHSRSIFMNTNHVIVAARFTVPNFSTCLFGCSKLSSVLNYPLYYTLVDFSVCLNW